MNFPATLAGGLRITPAFLESRRRSQRGGCFLLALTDSDLGALAVLRYP